MLDRHLQAARAFIGPARRTAACSSTARRDRSGVDGGGAHAVDAGDVLETPTAAGRAKSASPTPHRGAGAGAPGLRARRRRGGRERGRRRSAPHRLSMSHAFFIDEDTNKPQP